MNSFLKHGRNVLTNYVTVRQHSKLTTSLFVNGSGGDTSLHKEAFRDLGPSELEWSFHELDDHMQNVANGLLDLGFNDKKPLVVLGDKASLNAELIVTQLAALFAGVTLSPISSQPAEALKKTNARGLLFHPNLKDQVADILPELEDNEKLKISALRVANFPDLQFVVQTGTDAISDGVIQFENIMLKDPEPHVIQQQQEQNISDETVFFYGKLTHQQLDDQVQSFVKQLNLTAQDKICLAFDDEINPIPIVAALQQKAKIVLPASNSAEHYQEALQIEDCSIAFDGSSYQRR